MAEFWRRDIEGIEKECPVKSLESICIMPGRTSQIRIKILRRDKENIRCSKCRTR